MNEIDQLFNYPFYYRYFIDSFFKNYKINFRKSFGQNFIVDKNILKKYNNIFIEYFADDVVFEIGGGSGNLTWLLFNTAKSIVVFEIDNFFAEFLNNLFCKANVEPILKIKDTFDNNLQSEKIKKKLSEFLILFENKIVNNRYNNNDSSYKKNSNNNNNINSNNINDFNINGSNVNKFLNKVTIVKGDFLKVDLEKKYNEIVSKNIEFSKVNVFGNIPYNISSKIIQKLVKNKNLFKKIILTTQKEYYERLASIPGKSGKEVSYLTIFTQYNFEVVKIMDIKRNSFYPVPKVDSTVFMLVPKIQNDKDIKENEDRFFQFVSYCFSKKRKKIINSIKEYINKEYINKKYINQEYVNKECKKEKSNKKEVIIDENINNGYDKKKYDNKLEKKINNKINYITNLLKNPNLRPEQLTLNQWINVFKQILKY